MDESSPGREVDSLVLSKLEVVPQVVYVDEPVTVFSMDGSPSMSSRRVPVTLSVEFGPVAYARCLRQWSASYMPVPLQDRVTRQWALGFGAGGLLLAVVLAGSALGSHSVGMFVGAFLCGLVGWNLIWQTSESARRKDRAPGAGWSQSASSARGEAYWAMEQGHFGRAAALSDHAAWAQQIADQQRDNARLAAEAARRADAQYWENLETRPMAEQWTAALAFRRSIATEWSLRSGGAVSVEAAPVPTYDDIVAWLRSTSVAW